MVLTVPNGRLAFDPAKLKRKELAEKIKKGQKNCSQRRETCFRPRKAKT